MDFALRNAVVKKEWTMRRIAVVLVLVTCLLAVQGCKETSGPTIDVSELVCQMEPLQVNRTDEGLKTITLAQAIAWHETHEVHEHDDSETTPAAHEQSSQHVCLGVAVGYQAIRHAVGELFPEGVPQISDFDIKVNGPMDGVWDVMSLYTGRELTFEGEPKKLDLASFAFTAKRLSQDKTLVFRLQPGIIPQAFFTLKNQGATCANPEVGKAKRQALLNVLSAEPKDCFQVVDG